MKKIILLFILLQSVLGYSQSDSLLQRLKSSHGAKEEFKIWSNLADYYEYRGQMDSMRIAGEQMLSIGIQAKQDSLISSAYIVIGSYFAYVGDYNQSLVYLFKALNLSEECRSSSSICWAAKDIGIVYKSLRNFPEAIKYLRRAQDQLMNYVDPVDRNRTYTHLSECFLGLGQKDSALRYVQIANDVIIAGDDYGYARTLFIYASVYESSGDTDLAESYYKKCIAYALAHNVILPLANAAASYSNLLLNSGKYLPAKNYALQSLAASQQSSRKQDIINTAALLRTIYSQLGLKDSAYYYADMKDAYRDTIFNEQKIIQLQNIGFAQQIKEKEDQEKQVAQANERNQNLQYAAIVIALIT
ncbi:MAG TPA: tetratricopeptide repeat protein, partial [Parafilimonas sp.]|nr:tetratricopeptide repeat protein [Parafilimonas sp.]